MLVSPPGEGVATYRRHHKGGDSTALDGGHDRGDEDEHRPHRVVEELLQWIRVVT